MPELIFRELYMAEAGDDSGNHFRFGKIARLLHERAIGWQAALVGLGLGQDAGLDCWRGAR